VHRKIIAAWWKNNFHTDLSRRKLPETGVFRLIPPENPAILAD
jgi:hypothetical protein